VLTRKDKTPRAQSAAARCARDGRSGELAGNGLPMVHWDASGAYASRSHLGSSTPGNGGVDGDPASSYRISATLTSLMPTPVGPVPPDSNDPDQWDWSEFGAQVSPGRRRWQRALVAIVVVGLVILLIVNVL